MTTKQEEKLLIELGKLANRLKNNDTLVSNEIYKEIKEKQSELTFLLNCLVQCDE